MSHVRIALANVSVPTTPQESVLLATFGGRRRRPAGRHRDLLSRMLHSRLSVAGHYTAAPGSRVRRAGWAEVADAARAAHITVVLGTERVTDSRLADYRLHLKSRRFGGGMAGQGATRSVGGAHLSRARNRTPVCSPPGR
jgi:hypothetical protein